MAEDITHPLRNPFDVPPPQRGKGYWIAAIVALVLHVGLGFVLWKQRFELEIREFSDDVTDVEIIQPMAPPPPPPPPPPNTPPPPPPKLQPRPPVAVPNAPTIPPLPVPPVEKRIEEPKPPAPAPEPPRPSVITNPDWARRPSGEDIARYYPDRAQRMEVEGRVTLSCKVTARGLLEECSVIAEDPADQDFGSAALRMTRLFRMRPMTKDGSPVEGGTVRIPLRFQLPRG